MEYQLPRLIKMWTHLERQAGGKSRGMGEKQIEVDRRLLRSRIAQLRGKLDEVRFSPGSLSLTGIALHCSGPATLVLRFAGGRWA